VSDALLRFQNANEAPPPDAQNVTEKQENLRSSELSEFSTGRACCGCHEFPKERDLNNAFTLAIRTRRAAKARGGGGLGALIQKV